MNTYFCFNDESGDWNDKQRNFYVRASIIVNSVYLKKIENEINNIRTKLGLINLKEEIKWQDLWTIRKYFNKNKEPKDKRTLNIYNFLECIKKDHNLLIDYCEKVLSLLANEKNDTKIIITFTELEEYPHHKEEDIYRFHIQDHLQRLQMQFHDNLVIIIYDSIDVKKKELFKNIHKEIIENGDFIKEYSSIFESLLFDDSYDNKFIQFADFTAGCFSGVLNSIKKNDEINYRKSLEFFIKYINPKICINNKNEIWGIGIKETPKDDTIRNYYKNEINNYIQANTSKLIRNITI